MTQENIRPTVHYFGTERGPGHYLFAPRWERVRRSDAFDRLDGKLAPTGAQVQFIAWAWRIPKYQWSALSWWDRSQDSRPGSNSILFAPGVTVTIPDMKVLGERFFPEVMARGDVVLPDEWRTWE